MLNKQKIIKSFNASASHYHSAADIQPRIAERLARYLPAMTAKNILEIGCGTGLFSRYLQAEFPQAKILLTDMAPSMLEICQKHLAGHTNLAFMQMDGEYLSANQGFDLIASSMTLHWFSDIKKSLQQIISKLAPGGKLLFAMLGENSLQEWREICKAHHLTTTPEFISVSALARDFPALKIEVEVSQQVYKNTYEFFKTLKLIGATTPHPAHRSLTSGFLRHLMRMLDEKNSHGINITYEVIYGYLEKQ
jgi:malonyl-CoA O-methyltransferase